MPSISQPFTAITGQAATRPAQKGQKYSEPNGPLRVFVNARVETIGLHMMDEDERPKARTKSLFPYYE
ncbi:MAG: hypothetical protein BMS9Abin15_0681 [Gammaproteobacteria bacterium]|nr:MAG: hypothetical protein BMS9Abin15_0681 [Gammaproteobacteria bacterium]